MAPEQVEGRGIDVRSDLYAMGVLLFEALTGHKPYGGSLDDILRAQVTAPVPDPRSLVPDLAEGLAQLCMRNLAKNPAARDASADDFLAALHRGAEASFGPRWATAGVIAGIGAMSAAAAAAAPALAPVLAGAAGVAFGSAGSAALGGLASGAATSATSASSMTASSMTVSSMGVGSGASMSATGAATGVATGATTGTAGAAAGGSGAVAGIGAAKLAIGAAAVVAVGATAVAVPQVLGSDDEPAARVGSEPSPSISTTQIRDVDLGALTWTINGAVFSVRTPQAPSGSDGSGITIDGVPVEGDESLIDPAGASSPLEVTLSDGTGSAEIPIGGASSTYSYALAGIGSAEPTVVYVDLNDDGYEDAFAGILEHPEGANSYTMYWYVWLWNPDLETAEQVPYLIATGSRCGDAVVGAEPGDGSITVTTATRDGTEDCASVGNLRTERTVAIESGYPVDVSGHGGWGGVCPEIIGTDALFPPPAETTIHRAPDASASAVDASALEWYVSSTTFSDDWQLIWYPGPGGAVQCGWVEGGI